MLLHYGIFAIWEVTMMSKRILPLSSDVQYHLLNRISKNDRKYRKYVLGARWETICFRHYFSKKSKSVNCNDYNKRDPDVKSIVYLCLKSFGQPIEDLMSFFPCVCARQWVLIFYYLFFPLWRPPLVRFLLWIDVDDDEIKFQVYFFWSCFSNLWVLQ